MLPGAEATRSPFWVRLFSSGPPQAPRKISPLRHENRGPAANDAHVPPAPFTERGARGVRLCREALCSSDPETGTLAPVADQSHPVGGGRAVGSDASFRVRGVTGGDEWNHSRIVRRLVGRRVANAQVLGVTAAGTGVSAGDVGVTADVLGASDGDLCRYDACPRRSSRGPGRSSRGPRRERP
jgi:hypothetical protein